MIIKYGTTKTDSKNPRERGDNTKNMLDTTAGSTGFLYKCRKCGKKGHESKDYKIQ